MARLLLADDDEMVREAYAIALRKRGHDVFEASDAAGVIALLDGSAFDVVFTDIRMPGNHELQMLADIPAATPCVVLTGAASLETALVALRHGVLDYLEKPISFAGLLGALDRALAERSRRLAIHKLWEQARVMSKLVDSLQPPSQGGAGEADVGLDPTWSSRLNARERRLAKLLLRGLGQAAIAEELGITAATVSHEVRSLARAVDVRTPSDLVAALSA